MDRLHKLLMLLVLLLALGGCSLLKARAKKETVFLPKPTVISEQRERAPFNAYWVFDPQEYFQIRRSLTKVNIAPVDISYVANMYRQASGSEKTKARRIEESAELARYFRERLRIALELQNNHPVEVVDQPTADGLVVNLALTEVVPTNPGVNLVGTVAGFFVPGGGVIKYFGEGSVAMEGYVGDLKPEDVFEQFKDREGQKSAPFTVKDYQQYAHLRAAIDDWSDQIAKLLTTPPDVQVEDSIPVSLNPL